MRYCTEIKAIDPVDGEMKTWEGEHIEANTYEEAVEYCHENKGYLKVIGELVLEIPWNMVGFARYHSDN